jgi:AcrR family transcriptional regulator
VTGPPDQHPEPNTTPGRRERNRAIRHSQLMAAATEIVSAQGIEGLTMQLLAERVQCAVGTIYTYFDSKSSLLTALQISAIELLSDSVHHSRPLWEEAISSEELHPQTAALVRLTAFGHLFATAPLMHPREFELLQILLSTPRRATSDEDAMRVTPHALALIDQLRTLLEDAVESGALQPETPSNGAPDFSLGRTVRWTGAMNGALLVSNVAVVPQEPAVAAEESGGAFPPLASGLFDGRALAIRVARDFLLGWGAEPSRLQDAEEFVERLRRADQLVRPGSIDDDPTIPARPGTAAG